MDKYISKSATYTNASGNSKRLRPDGISEDGWQLPKRTATGKSPAKPLTPTTNRFGKLQAEQGLDPVSATNLRAATTRKKTHIPPILIKLQDHWTHNTVKELITKVTTSFHLQYRGKGKVAVHCYAPSTHAEIKKSLQDENIGFFSYTRRDEKLYKAVIRGVPPIEEDDLAEELATLGFKDAKVTLMKQTAEGSSYYPPFLVQLPSGTDIQKFRQIKYLSNCVVNIRKYNPRNTAVTQCFRCQEFGHASKNCNMPPRCVKCEGAHLTMDCPKKDRQTPAQCCNCHESHPANYQQCTTRLGYLERLQKQRDAQVKQSMKLSKQSNFDGRSWAAVTSNDRVHDARPTSMASNPVLPVSAKSSSEDSTTKEMLQILNIVKNLKQQFLACESMVDKVILILTHLDKYV